MLLLVELEVQWVTVSQRGLIDLDLTEAVSFNPSALSFSIFCPFIDFFSFQFLVWNISPYSQTYWRGLTCCSSSGPQDILNCWDINKKSWSGGRGADGLQRLYFIAAFELVQVFSLPFPFRHRPQTVNLLVAVLSRSTSHVRLLCSRHAVFS